MALSLRSNALLFSAACVIPKATSRDVRTDCRIPPKTLASSAALGMDKMLGRSSIAVTNDSGTPLGLLAATFIKDIKLVVTETK